MSGGWDTYEAVVVTADRVGLAGRTTAGTDTGDGGASNTNEAIEVVGGDSEQTKETRDRLAVRLKKTKCVNINY